MGPELITLITLMVCLICLICGFAAGYESGYHDAKLRYRRPTVAERKEELVNYSFTYEEPKQ